MDPASLREVARADLPAVLLGCCIFSAGIAPALVIGARRRWDALWANFALFAALYGARMVVQTTFFAEVIGGGTGWARVVAALTFLVPIPAVFFFIAMGWMPGRQRFLGYAFAVVESMLALVTLSTGVHPWASVVNNVAAAGAIALLASGVLSAMRSAEERSEGWVISAGLGIFVVLALLANLAALAGLRVRNFEPLGFVTMLAALGYVTARRTLRREEKLIAIESELDIARRIQQSILPAKLPGSARLSVAARYVPMTSVAGDFYEMVGVSESHVGVLVADVSGHGVPAALIASMVKLAATSQAEHASQPDAFLEGMNRALLGNTQSQFVTAAYLSIDVATGVARYAGAAHPPMVLVRAGATETIEENGLMLAAFSFATYATRELKLQARDRLVLYTDGLPEAMNQYQEEFGAERLQKYLLESASLSPEEAADFVLERVHAWAPVANDDRTLLVCDYLG